MRKLCAGEARGLERCSIAVAMPNKFAGVKAFGCGRKGCGEVPCNLPGKAAHNVRECDGK